MKVVLYPNKRLVCVRISKDSNDKMNAIFSDDNEPRP